MTLSSAVYSVKINPNAASVKTRRRIKQNGPLFEKIDKTAKEDSVYLRSLKTKWEGWIPLAEVSLKN
jgi:hypothetical protein